VPLSAIAIEARKRKIALPADVSIDAEVDWCLANDAYFLQARLNVSLPGGGAGSRPGPGG
jgi:osmotically inducible protein OsmC